MLRKIVTGTAIAALTASTALAEGELAAFGITHQLYDPMDVTDLAARITPAAMSSLAAKIAVGRSASASSWRPAARPWARA